jgi:hypothetical protein
MFLVELIHSVAAGILSNGAVRFCDFVCKKPASTHFVYSLLFTISFIDRLLLLLIIGTNTNPSGQCDY